MADESAVVRALLDKFERVIDRQNELAEKLERLIGMVEAKDKNCDRHNDKLNELEMRIGRLEVKTAMGSVEHNVAAQVEKDNSTKIIAWVSIVIAAAGVYIGWHRG